MIMSSFVWLLFGILNADTLYEMPIITLEDGETYILKVSYCSLENSEFTMNGRCYSLLSQNGEEIAAPQSPGPTLKMISGTNPRIILQNDFFNSIPIEAGCHNKWCDLDMTNVHTHGLHISSAEDNVVNDVPGKIDSSDAAPDYTYSYNIPDNHYPGIHWYHPHNHGSVSHQIHFGLFGALITEYPNANNYNNDIKLYTDSINSYKTTILVFSHVYAVNTDLCVDSCDEVLQATVAQPFAEGIGAFGRCIEHGKACFHIYSACYEWCAFGTRFTSGLQYNINIKDTSKDIDQYFLVNGQYDPSIDNIEAGKYRRLQFVNTVHQYYIHYDLPNECDFYLLGYDGVFFDIENDQLRNLNEYENELLLAPGSRADLLVKCDHPGVYDITTIANGDESELPLDIDGELDGLERAGSDEKKNLFRLIVVNDGSGDDTISELPTASSFPAKPEYLKDLRQVDNVITECACNQYSPTDSCDGDTCCIHYNSKDGIYTVNDVEFSGNTNDFLTYLMQDSVYEFILKVDRHTHHQHVYPFQLQFDVASGFIAKSGDWFDTFGAEFMHTIRTYTADFNGYQVLHCHFLPHEDMGMMAITYVISPDEVNDFNSLSCLPDLVSDAESDDGSDTESGTDEDNETPSPVAPAPAPGKQKGNKPKGANIIGLFDMDFNVGNINFELIFISFFVILALCNTCVICNSNVCNNGGNKKYSSVTRKDIDDPTDNEEDDHDDEDENKLINQDV